MKKKNGLSIFCIVVGIIVLLIGAFFAGQLYLNGEKVELVKGDIKTVENAKDEEFNIEVESAVLVRQVRMLQYYNDNGQVKKALTNYPIEAFEINGTKYENPEFSKDITTEIFYGKAKINDVELGESVLEALAYDTVSDVKKNQCTDLDFPMAVYHKLTIKDGVYVSASDDYEVGDIEVSYYYFDEAELKNMTAAGEIKDGKLELAKDSLYKGNVSESQVKINLYDGMEIYLGIAAIGIILILIGIISSKRANKNNGKENA